jgi:hypothetical protein
VEVKLTCIAEMTCEVKNKRKVYKKGYISENFLVLRMELKKKCVLSLRFAKSV